MRQCETRGTASAMASKHAQWASEHQAGAATAAPNYTPRPRNAGEPMSPTPLAPGSNGGSLLALQPLCPQQCGGQRKLGQPPNAQTPGQLVPHLKRGLQKAWTSNTADVSVNEHNVAHYHSTHSSSRSVHSDASAGVAASNASIPSSWSRHRCSCASAE